jgi:hypothetical protein
LIKADRVGAPGFAASKVKQKILSEAAGAIAEQSRQRLSTHGGCAAYLFPADFIADIGGY